MNRSFLVTITMFAMYSGSNSSDTGYEFVIRLSKVQGRKVSFGKYFYTKILKVLPNKFRSLLANDRRMLIFNLCDDSLNFSTPIFLRNTALGDRESGRKNQIGIFRIKPIKIV